MSAQYKLSLSYTPSKFEDQDYPDTTVTQCAPYASSIAYAFAAVIFAYHFLLYLRILPPFAFSRLVWKLIVMLSPTSLVVAMDKNPSAKSKLNDIQLLRGPAREAAKEEAIRRVLNLGNTSFFSPTVNGGATDLVYSRPKVLTPQGLGNINNSCYQNSVIQGFASLRRLKLFLEYNLQEYGTQKMSTHLSLAEMIIQLNQLSYRGGMLWLPKELKSMCSWQQQDAQEYYSKVMEQIDREACQASKLRLIGHGLKLESQPSEKPSVLPQAHSRDVSSKNVSSEVTSLHHSPLEGLTAQRVGCMTCGYCEGLSLIPFTCLTVPLAQRPEYDLRDCLDDYTALEPIEGVECAKCTLLRTRDALIEFVEKLESQDSEPDFDQKTQKQVFHTLTKSRLEIVQQALRDEDFSESTLSEKCRINSKSRVSTTKSRQSVIARAPESLVIHINRSVFDEFTGVLRKNYARVIFPDILDIDEWCLGSKENDLSSDPTAESWETDPTKPMLSSPDAKFRSSNRKYELRAAITHYGRHDDGHYVCYKKMSIPIANTDLIENCAKHVDGKEQWFEMNDADVYPVSKDSVMSQGGVFMLFYELIETSSSTLVSGVGDSLENISSHTLVNASDSHPDSVNITVP
ncbi:ubiquitin-specific protease ubp1 [Ophidiomyces ophidiicola]|nr:ubiquitin-specific protease ubp1 [Ophidiomyces ophidiicola]KAI1991768.1 ubiquitin-specific protease ubp1 [Ophidiomyces ophidiicola]KAI1996208.1 ubiquitin-specific protease ubp1 [Ophidiomyces ophidiicola]